MTNRIAEYWTRLRSGAWEYRDLQIAKGAAGLLFHRATTISVNLVTVPVLYAHLGREAFGVVMALLAVGVAVSFADLGIGNGLQNYLAEVQDDRSRVAAALKTGIAYASVVAAALCAMLWYVAGVAPLQSVFGTSAISGPDLTTLVRLLIVILTLQIPLSLGQRVLAAFQRSHLHSAYLTAASVVSLFCVLACVALQAATVYVLLALALPTLVAHALALVHAVVVLSLPLGSASMDMTEDIRSAVIKTGLVFFVIQAAYTAQLTADNLFVSSRLGAGELADYSLVMRVIAVLVLPITALATPILGGANDALAKGDRVWLRGRLKRVGIMTCVNAAIVSLAFVTLAEPLLELWIGRAFDLSAGLLLSYVVVLLFQSFSIPLSTALLTGPLVRRGAICYLVAVCVAIPVKWYALGSGGVSAFNLWGGLTFGILYLVPAAYLTYRVLYRGDGLALGYPPTASD